jgi:hypothetical protein
MRKTKQLNRKVQIMLQKGNSYWKKLLQITQLSSDNTTKPLNNATTKPSEK